MLISFAHSFAPSYRCRRRIARHFPTEQVISALASTAHWHREEHSNVRSNGKGLRESHKAAEAELASSGIGQHGVFPVESLQGEISCVVDHDVLSIPSRIDSLL